MRFFSKKIDPEEKRKALIISSRLWWEPTPLRELARSFESQLDSLDEAPDLPSRLSALRQAAKDYAFGLVAYRRHLLEPHVWWPSLNDSTGDGLARDFLAAVLVFETSRMTYLKQITSYVDSFNYDEIEKLSAISNQAIMAVGNTAMSFTSHYRITKQEHEQAKSEQQSAVNDDDVK